MHRFIAGRGFDLLPGEIKERWKARGSILKTCQYPDIFADRNIRKEEKEKIDPEADLYLEPAPPETIWYRQLLRKSRAGPVKYLADITAEERIYILFHYLKNTIACLKRGDPKRAAKFAGVLSHYVGDLVQPIHLLNPQVIDLLIEVPEKFMSFELHSGIESISGYPQTGDYEPEILGDNFARALMGLYRKLTRITEAARYTTIPLIKAVYASQAEETVKLAEKSVRSATIVFSDFLRTAWALAHNEKIIPRPLDLADYPWIGATVDMLYRYRPIRNFSLIPYSNGKKLPLTLLDENRKPMRVSGLGVIPYLGPLKTVARTIKARDARVDFLVWPGSYSKLKAKVGLNPLFRERNGQVVFRVFADDKLIGKRGPFSPADPYADFAVALPQKMHFLTLSALTTVEPSQPTVTHHPHDVWADPVLE